MRGIAVGGSRHLGARLMSLMHGLRREVFVRRGARFQPTANQVERDRYDIAGAHYLVVTDASGRNTAAARLLPTTGPHMLPDLFPQLLAGHAAPRSADLYELSRFRAGVSQTRDGRALALCKATLDLLELVLVFARQREIARLVLVTSIGTERLMLRAGLAVHRIAPPAVVQGELSVALFIEVPADTPAALTGEPALSPRGTGSSA